MATCDPKTLPAQAACFRCLTHGQKREINLYLLSVISGLNTPNAMRQAGRNFRMFQGLNYLAAKTYLLDLLDGSMSGSALAQAANCFQCIPEDSYLSVETYLLASATAFGTDPKTLVGPAAQFRPLVERYEEVELGALATIVSATAAQVGQNLSCFKCISPNQLVDINLYLECLGFGANIVPPGSVYTGNPPEFDLVVQANTSYHIVWGANDLYVIICGQRYDSGGAGTSTNVFTGSCTLMQFFGTFAGTSVTVNVTPVHNVKVVPYNYTFNLTSSTNAQATWATPPSGVVSTEVWTSTDNITYTLAATVAAPGTSANFTAPTVGNVLWAKARWIYSDGGNGGFTKPLEVFGNVADWAARVIINGGAAVSSATIGAVNTFYGSINAVGTLIGKVKAMNIVAPDSVIAARTPLIKTFGNDPWIQIGTFAVTVNGIIATAATSCLRTGVVPSTAFASVNTGGLSVYVTVTTAADTAAVDIGGQNSTAQVAQLFSSFNTNFAIQQIYNNTNGQGSLTGTSHGTGFYCANIPSAGQEALYYYSSSLGFTTLATAAASGGTRPTVEIYAMGLNNAGVTTGTTQIRRYSFFAIHDGLTSAEANALATAVQNLRVAFGGGFV